MAANMMEILRQMNRYIDIIEGKVSELDKKMDQQQITIENLEQQVKKNNALLFGNDETDILLQNNTTNKTDLVDKKNKTDLMVEFEETDNKINDDKNTQHIVLESITNELREITIFLKDFEATMKTMSLDKDNVVQMSHTYSNADQISKLRKEIKRDCNEIKDLIKDSGAINKVSTDAVSTDKKEEEKKEGEKDELEKEEEIVQISPAYFSADQISKLNEELKRIAKIYRSTNTFPTIEVLQGGQEHPVMIQLRNGVTYKKFGAYCGIKIKLGLDGYKTSEVQEILYGYPDLTLTDVVKALLKSRKWTLDQLRDYDFKKPLPYESIQNQVQC